MIARIVLLCICLVPAAADAASLDVAGYADFRLIVPPTQGSYYYGDLGKLRYGYDNGRTAAKLAGLIGEARLHVIPELMIEATGRIDPNYGNAADLIEAFARYRPVSTGPWVWTVKAGAFFPPGSLENDQIGWTSPWTITPSAINSWIGYELRTIGAEGSLQWRREIGTLTLSGALFERNDPAGVLMADRGWSLDDRVSGLFEREREPDALAVMFHESPPLYTSLFREIDNRPGWYAYASWKEPDLADFSLTRYDNNADPSAERGGMFAWHTNYWEGGAKKQIDNITLMAQALTGSTEIAPLPTYHSVTNFSSAYALAGLDLDDWRLAARFDLFRTHALSRGSLMSENGDAGTFDATWFARTWLQITAEAIVLGSERDQRILVGDAPRDTERQFQLMARVFF